MRVTLVLLCVLVAGCGTRVETGGDRANGRLLLRQFGCGQCHRIPGVANAQGDVGPPLEKAGDRAYLGGVLPNTPENMAQWIREPRRFDPRTQMPAMGVTPAQAQDMVAYLWQAK